MMVSAPNAGALFDLRCTVREGMVSWVQRTPHAVVPAQRIKPAPAEVEPPLGRAFDDTTAYEEEFVTPNGRA